MNNQDAKKILKVAVLIYLSSFLIINWNDVSWIFNYREVSGLVSDFFNPYPTIDASTMDAYFYPNHSQNSTTTTTQLNNATVAQGTQQTKEIKTTYTEKQNTLEIPKINISAPIIFATSTNTAILTKTLDSGVVQYPGSVYPGQIGQIVILGHSAPLGWPKIKYDWVFSDLDKLTAGDNILIDLNNKQYTYVVKSKKIIQRGADIPQDESNTKKSILTLISCWPPGKDYQRITITAELVIN